MLSDNAEEFLQAMGLKTSTPGAVRSADIPPLIEKLENYIKQKMAAPSVGEEKFEDETPPVSVHKRSIPLMALLKHAVATEEIVSWESA